jgi:hypothetical protein
VAAVKLERAQVAMAIANAIESAATPAGIEAHARDAARITGDGNCRWSSH